MPLTSDVGNDTAPDAFRRARQCVLAGDRTGAEACYRAVIAADPAHAPACRDLGCLCFEAGRFDEAVDWLSRAVRLDPDEVGGWQNLGHALYRLDRTAEAAEAFDAALARAPERADLLVARAALFEQEHRLDDARVCAEAALAADPEFASADVLLARLALRNGAADDALDRLDRLDAARLSPLQQLTWHTERGRALDQLGRYADAFAAFGAAHAAVGAADAAAAQDVAARTARMAGIEIGLTRDELAARACCDTDDAAAPQPIFVLGFMRTGTTLIERILGAHPEITPMGELRLIGGAVDRLDASLPGGWPNGLLALAPDEARAVLTQERRLYLDGVAALPGAPADGGLFVDKAPFNAEHIALVRLLFPRAPILCALRHPLDTVLSCWFINFADPQPWSWSLPAAAALFARLNAHLDRMAPRFKSPLHTVRYERLVAEPEPVMRAMLDHAGVGWNPACLNFHAHAGGARTASYAQVTRPLNADSVARYRNYLEFIDPAVVDNLRPALAALGYDLPDSAGSQ